MLVCVLSVAVILPVNFSGDLLGRCFPSCGMTQEHGTSFPTLGLSTLPWGQGGEGPLHQEPQCEQEHIVSCGTEECKRQGASGQWGLGRDLGDGKGVSKDQSYQPCKHGLTHCTGFP